MKRMKANRRVPNGYHGYEEHIWTKGCDTQPSCAPMEYESVELQPPSGPAGVSAAPSTYEPPPKHYATDRGIDPWAVWDAFDLDRYTANAVKYLLRAGKKDIAPRLDDLKKARNYINKAIEMEENR